MLPSGQFLWSREGTVSLAIFGGTPSAAAIKGGRRASAITLVSAILDGAEHGVML
jgi:hypothetical protein